MPEIGARLKLKMHRICYAIGVTLLTSTNLVYALDCQKVGVPMMNQSHGSNVELGRTIDHLRARDSRALSSGTGTFVLIRRFVTGEVAARGGSIAAELPLARIGKDLSITYRQQKLEDFARDQAFSGMSSSTIVRVRQEICGASALCNTIYPGDRLVNLLADLLDCNSGRTSVFEFDDAFVALDMKLIENMPIGEAVIVRKKQELPKTLVIFQ